MNWYREWLIKVSNEGCNNKASIGNCHDRHALLDTYPCRNDSSRVRRPLEDNRRQLTIITVPICRHHNAMSSYPKTTCVSAFVKALQLQSIRHSHYVHGLYLPLLAFSRSRSNSRLRSSFSLIPSSNLFLAPVRSSSLASLSALSLLSSSRSRCVHLD